MQLFKRVLLPFLWGKGTFSVPSKRERQFDFLFEELIDKDLCDFQNVPSISKQTSPPHFRGR